MLFKKGENTYQCCTSAVEGILLVWRRGCARKAESSINCEASETSRVRIEFCALSLMLGGFCILPAQLEEVSWDTSVKCCSKLTSATLLVEWLMCPFSEEEALDSLIHHLLSFVTPKA